MELSPVDDSRVTRSRKYSTDERDEATKIDISIPGLNKVVDRTTEKPARIIWMITLLICAIACTYLTVDRLVEYFKYPTASKTVIERKEIVQFPSLTICQMLNENCYVEELEKEIKNKCWQKGIVNCDADTISIRALGIDLQNVWHRCHFIYVNATDGTTNSFKRSSDYPFEIIRRHTVMGPCATVTFTKKVIYFSATTVLIVEIHVNKGGLPEPILVFLPHLETEISTIGYELLNHEVEILSPRHQSNFKLREQVFKLENITGRECYDQESGKNDFVQKILNIFSDRNLRICRLPYLSSAFPECVTLNYLRVSYDESRNLSMEIISNHFNVKRLCHQTTYGISTHYSYPLAQNDADGNDVIKATILVKFADNTRMVVSEYFSYTFPSLVSDLFAYWGFFLCLSALVFAEIIEFTIRKIYQWCKKRYVLKNSV